MNADESSSKDAYTRALLAVCKGDKQFLIDQAKQGALFGDEILTRILVVFGKDFLFSLYELALSPEQWKQCCLAKSQTTTNEDVLELGEPNKYFLSACLLARNSTLLQYFATRENVRLSMLFAAAMGNCEYLQLFRESSVCREHRPDLLRWMVKYEQKQAFEECLEEDAYAGTIELDKYLLACARYGRVEYAKRVYQMLGNVNIQQLKKAASKHADFLVFLDKHQELMD